MSKLKSPRAKKAASLSRDRRQVHDENGKASRKSIPRAKARTQRTHRRAVHQALVHPEPLTSDVEVEATENKLSKAARARQSKGFRKEPDVPLGEYLERKHIRRAR